MKIINCEQNSDEWIKARLGLPTASSFEKIVTTKGEPSKQRQKLLYKLTGEIITGVVQESYYNGNMALGHEREDEARKLYEFMNDCKVDQVGFCLHYTGLYGSSPDGLVNDNGGFETKNALPHVQAERLDKGWSKADHFQQVQGNLLVTDREWWDLMSYSRGMKPIVIRFERDENFIKKLDHELKAFAEDLEKLVEKCRG